MKRSIRLIFGLFVALFLILIIIISLLMFFIDPNRLKPILIDAVKQKTGYQLSIDGDLSWSFYPRAGIKAHHMQLRASNAQPVFLDLQNVSLSTDLFSLLHDRQRLLGEVNIGQVLLGKVLLSAVQVNVHWQNQVLLLQPITGRFYGGTITGTATGQDFSQSMRWSWQVQGKNVDIKSLLKDLNDHQAKLTLSGLAQVNFQGTTSGKGKQAILSHLNGTLTFNLQRGALEGVDLNYLIQKVSTIIRERKFALNQDEATLLSRQTQFQQLTGTAVIKDGIVKNNDLLLTSSNFTAKANGTINLLTQQIDYRLQILPSHATNIPWSIPVIFDGDLRRPHVRLDLVTLNTLIAKEQLEKAKTKIEENIDKLPEKAQQFLGKLLR